MKIRDEGMGEVILINQCGDGKSNAGDFLKCGKIASLAFHHIGIGQGFKAR